LGVVAVFKQLQRFVALEKQPQREIGCCGCFLNNYNALWHERNSHNAKLGVVAVFKQLQRFVA